MNPVSFDFGNAIMHFRKTGGPKGFLLKFGATYAVLYLLVQVASILLQWPMLKAMFSPDLMGDPQAMETAMMGNTGRVLLGYLLLLPLGLVFWMLFEGANQRRYMRAEGFHLRLGADEWRLLVVGLIWAAFFIVLYIGMIVVIAVPTGIIAAIGTGEAAVLGGLLVFVLSLAFMVLALWLAARFSPAAALTVRDRRIQFGQAWRVTKGKGWTIVGTWIVLMLIMSVVFFVLYLVFVVILFAVLMPVISSMETGDSSAVLAGMLTPGVLVPGGVLLVALIFLQACWMHIFSGPAALAARTDPEWADSQAIRDTFV